MENHPEESVAELEERQQLRPHWLNSTTGSSAGRPLAERPPAARRRPKAGPAKPRRMPAKPASSPLSCRAEEQHSDLYQAAQSALRDQSQAYPEYIINALSAADEAQAAGESELTIALIKLVCELLYEMGRRP